MADNVAKQHPKGCIQKTERNECLKGILLNFLKNRLREERKNKPHLIVNFPKYGLDNVERLW